MYTGELGKLLEFFFKNNSLNTNLLKGTKQKKMASIKKCSFMPKVPFEAVYIMAKPYSPKTQPEF